jgi:hypothetical protein
VPKALVAKGSAVAAAGAKALVEMVQAEAEVEAAWGKALVGTALVAAVARVLVVEVVAVAILRDHVLRPRRLDESIPSTLCARHQAKVEVKN